MTPEQAARLNALQDKLLETVFREADPDNWIGGDKMTSELDRDERGDRYWCMKTAAQAILIYTRLQVMGTQASGMAVPHEGEDLDDEIKRSEREAKKILDRVQKGMTKRDAKA